MTNSQLFTMTAESAIYMPICKKTKSNQQFHCIFCWI